MITWLENIKEDSIIPIIQGLIDLNIPEICEQISQVIYSIEKDERFIYASYLSEEQFFLYLNAKKQHNTSSLQKIPSPVIPFYELLETLQKVSKTFEDLDTIPLAKTEDTFKLAPRAWTLLQNNIPEIEQSINKLANTHILIHQMIQPLFQLMISRMVDIKTSMISSKNEMVEFYSLNKVALSQMIPTQSGGLAVLTKLILLAPNLIKELTQWIERDDKIINFDPLDSQIITAEQEFYKILQMITKNNQMVGFVGLTKLLFSLKNEISLILKESIPLTKASYDQLNQRKKIITDYLDEILIQLESIEENLALKTGTLSTPYQKAQRALVESIDQKLSLLKKLPKNLKSIRHTLKGNVVKIVESTSKNLIDSVTSSTKKLLNKTPSITSTLSSIPTKDALIDMDRLKRYKKAENFSAKGRKACRDFFKTITSNQQYTNYPSIQFIPEKHKIPLKENYLVIQELFQAIAPQLDADIMRCFEATENQTAISLNYQPKSQILLHQGLCVLFLNIAKSLIYLSISWEFMFGLLGVWYLSLSNLKIPNQFTIILKHQADIELALEQKIYHQKTVKDMIEKRFHNDHPQIKDISQFITEQPIYQSIVIQNEAPLPKTQSFFMLLNQEKPSQKIANFEKNYLFPFLYQILQPNVYQHLFDAENKPLQQPFLNSYKDDEIIEAYKHLLNMFYNLKVTLVKLEKIEEHGYPIDNFSFQMWKVVDVLVPILTSGLQTINNIKDLLKNKRLEVIQNSCLSFVDQVKTIVEMKYPFIINTDQALIQERPFHAYSAWKDIQEMSHIKTHKKMMTPQPSISTEEKIVQPNDHDEEKAFQLTIEKKEEPLKVKNIIKKFAKIQINIHHLHENIFNPQALYEPKNKKMKAEKDAKQFIKYLREQIKSWIYEGNKINTRKTIHAIKEFDFNSEKINQAFGDIGVTNFIDIIQSNFKFIDGIAKVIQIIFEENQDANFDKLMKLYDLIGYSLLTEIDDIEHQHLKYGSISNPVQEKLDYVFEILITKFAPQRLFEFWMRQNIFKGRINHQVLQIKSKKKELKNLQQDKPKTIIQKDIQKLQKILQYLQKNKSEIPDLSKSNQFRYFLNIYSHLQPKLFRIDPNFDQINFLNQIKKHRPETAITAIKKILARQKDIDALLDAQQDNRENALHQHRALIKSINIREKTIHPKNILHTAIKKIIKDDYSLKIGAHYPYFQDLIIQDFDKTEYFNQLQKIMHTQNPQEFESKLRETIKELMEYKKLKTIFSILEHEHHYIVQLQNEINLAYKTKSNLPSKYRFVQASAPSENNIEIYKGYSIIKKNSLPQRDEMLSNEIYITKSEFSVLDTNGERIQGALEEKMGNRPEESIKAHIIEALELNPRQLFYKTQKSTITPVPQEFLEDNKIDDNQSTKKIVDDLNGYIREFLKYSDEQKHTDEEKPCLKQKVKMLQKFLENAKHKNIQEKINLTLQHENPQEDLSRLNHFNRYTNKVKTSSYRRKVKYFNQLMLIDDQLEQIVKIDNTYQKYKANIHNEKLSAEDRFFKFSQDFKSEKRFFTFSPINELTQNLAKKRWRGSVYIESLKKIKSGFSEEEQTQINKLIDTLQSNSESFIPLDKRLGDFFDLISQEEFLNLFLKPLSIFDRILQIFGFPTAQEKFLQELRKDNRLLNLSMTLHELNPQLEFVEEPLQKLQELLFLKDYQIERVDEFPENTEYGVIYVFQNPKEYYIKGSDKKYSLPEDIDINNHEAILNITQRARQTGDFLPLSERMKLFQLCLDGISLPENAKKKLQVCLPSKNPDINISKNVRENFRKKLTQLKAINPQFSQKIDPIINNFNNYTLFKKETRELNAHLQSHTQKSWSSFFSHLVGQTTNQEKIIESVKKQVEIFEEAEKIKSKKAL